jgi:type VI secretion system protein ImpF
MSGRSVPDWTRRGGGPTETRVQQSVLDRLMDDAPDEVSDRPPSAAEAMVALRRAVTRDLEALLNARRRWRSSPPAFAELPTSLLGYGIPDFSAGAFNNPKRREQLRAEIEVTIRRFEPRFQQVQVTLLPGDALEPTLRLRIDALLRAEPLPEPIVFDTTVDPVTADITVRSDRDLLSASRDDV